MFTCTSPLQVPNILHKPRRGFHQSHHGELRQLSPLAQNGVFLSRFSEVKSTVQAEGPLPVQTPGGLCEALLNACLMTSSISWHHLSMGPVGGRALFRGGDGQIYRLHMHGGTRKNVASLFKIFSLEGDSFSSELAGTGAPITTEGQAPQDGI